MKLLFFIMLLFSHCVFASSERDALKALGKAAYKQTDLDDYARKMEKKYISKEMKDYTAWAILVIKTITEKKISYRWTF